MMMMVYQSDNKMRPSFLSVIVFFVFLCMGTTANQYLEQHRKQVALDRSRYQNIISRIKMMKSMNRPLSFPDEAAAISHGRSALDTTTANGSTELISIKLPLYSMTEYGVGVYVTEIRFGTPAKTYRLIMDTGSDLTWMRCQYNSSHYHRKRHHHHHRHHHRKPKTQQQHSNNNNNKKKQSDSDPADPILHRKYFHADRSKSFRMELCRSHDCQTSLIEMFSTNPISCRHSTNFPCRYKYEYQSMNVMGFFGEETSRLPLTVRTNDDANKIIKRSTVKEHNLIGCTYKINNDNTSNLVGSDGVLGMSINLDHSVGYKSAFKFGGKFSYCLVDRFSPVSHQGYLIFGDNKEFVKPNRHSNIQYTALTSIRNFYALDAKGISVNGVMLDIPIDLLQVKTAGGFILDSGTTLTTLYPYVYEKVTGAILDVLLPRFPNVIPPGELIMDFSYCFNASMGGYKESQAPKLVIHFADGVNFEPPPNNYIIECGIPTIRCLGIIAPMINDPTEVTSILGNTIQQNYIWQFDLQRKQLGFGPSNCGA